MKKLFVLMSIVVMISVTGLINTARAEIGAQNDLWDVSTGVIITGSTPILTHDSGNYSGAANMFGNIYGLPEPESTLFEDCNYWSGSYHYITWKTPSPVTLTNFDLYTASDAAGNRGFSQFRLYAYAGSTWQLLYTFTPSSFPLNYVSTPYSASISSVTAQDFKAEFDWKTYTYYNSGPRIIELDGFNTPIPEPATMSLLGLGLLGLLGFKKRIS